jgi:hypothetical protein
MDDLKIAELFIHSPDMQSHLLGRPLAIAASGDAYSLVNRFSEIDREITILPTKSAPILDWSNLVTKGQEQWPIGFLMPSGALIK